MMDMKMRIRLKGRFQHHHWNSSSFLLKKGSKDGNDREKSPSPVPKRDRSRSLCAENGAAHLLSVKSEQLIPGRPPIGRRRASNFAPLSASSDFLSRRGVFSRRHYGSVEMLPQPDADGNDTSGKRFRVENGESLGEREEMFGSPTTPILENPEYQTRWYFKFFLGKLHQNYVGSIGEKGQFLLSVVLSDANNQGIPQYRCILWKKTGAQKISLCYSPSKPLTLKQIISNFTSMEKIDKGPRELFIADIQKDLLLLEEQEGSVNFKFGVLYMKAGQASDNDILSNETGSKQFENFLSLLGNKVKLKGWDKFRGGLDVKGDMTGRYSIYTIYEGHEIMFHVSTLLPFSNDNKQQVERKRHIGNDIVNIIFLDGRSQDLAGFSPSFIKSQFTHIFVVVMHDTDDHSYRLHVYSEETVPLFGPSLPTPPVFHNHQEFREFFLVKLINGEKATFNTPTFARKRERTLHMLIKDIYEEHINDTRGTMLNRRAFSDVLPDPPKLSRRKEEARQVEFVRFGQALKLDTIVKGDAPTSLATTGLLKRTPWEPQCYYPDFPYEVFCGDSWHGNKIFLATSDGVYLVEEGNHHRLVFDRTVNVKQLNVVEAHGILLIRIERGRDNKVYVFRLSDFEYDMRSESSSEEENVKTKHDVKDHRLDRTKGCHLYAISRPGGSHLRMVVAVGKKLILLQWRHSTAWTAWCPTSDSDTIDGFIYLKEINVSETPCILTLVDSTFASSAGGSSDNKICVGYKNHWDLANERTGEITRLFSVESSRATLVASIDIYEDDEPELLLCYNNTCHFQKLGATDTTTEFDFQWNAKPYFVVCAFPYILAFTHDSIEIRLVVNGNLVQTMVMPHLSFVCSKTDIFFATTAPEFFSQPDSVSSDKMERDQSISPPASPSSSGDYNFKSTSFDRESPMCRKQFGQPFRIYRIPFISLAGAGSCERRCPTPSTPMNTNPPTHESPTPITEPATRDKTVGGNVNLDVNQSSLSRSCSSSPTHSPSFKTNSSTNNATQLVTHPKKPPPVRQRNRTNSLTVEMLQSNRLLSPHRATLLPRHKKLFK